MSLYFGLFCNIKVICCTLCAVPIYWYKLLTNTTQSVGFTYRLDRLKPRVSKFRRPPAKVYNILTLLLDFHAYAFITYCTF